MWNFVLLERPRPSGDILILLCSRFDAHYRFGFQAEEEKILPKEMKMKQEVVSLEDMILSFRECLVGGKLPKWMARIKDQLAERLFKHLCYELKQLEKCTDYAYKVNVLNVHFNTRKEFFFLSPDPVLAEWVLQYEQVPAASDSVLRVEREKETEDLFLAPEEVGKAYKKLGIHLSNTKVYKLLRVVSALRELKYWNLYRHQSEAFFRRRLDGSEECRALFG